MGERAKIGESCSRRKEAAHWPNTVDRLKLCKGAPETAQQNQAIRCKQDSIHGEV